jgi:hypothetical protein
MTRWELWRQDDNGNRYRISAHGDRDDAEAALAGMESGLAHKQMYWIAEKGDAPAPPGPPNRPA